MGRSEEQKKEEEVQAECTAQSRGAAGGTWQPPWPSGCRRRLGKESVVQGKLCSIFLVYN